LSLLSFGGLFLCRLEQILCSIDSSQLFKSVSLGIIQLLLGDLDWVLLLAIVLTIVGLPEEGLGEGLLVGSSLLLGILEREFLLHDELVGLVEFLLGFVELVLGLGLGGPGGGDALLRLGELALELLGLVGLVLGLLLGF